MRKTHIKLIASARIAGMVAYPALFSRAAGASTKISSGVGECENCAFKGRDSAADQSAAADCSDRRAAGQHSGRCATDPSMAATFGDVLVGRYLVRVGFALVSVDLAVPVNLSYRESCLLR